MPFLVLGVVGFIAFLWVGSNKADSKKGGSSGTTPNPPQKPKTDIVKPNSGNDIVAGLRIASDLFVGAAFSSEGAKTVAKFGLGLAIAVGTLNIAAGIIVAMVVLFVASVIEIISVAQDMTSDNHQLGIDDYWEQWDKVRAQYVNHITSKAAVANQKVDETELMNASNAYADGFMEWKNYLTVWRANQGALYGPGTSGGINYTSGENSKGRAAVERAWRTGKYAGEIRADLSLNAASDFPGVDFRIFPMVNLTPAGSNAKYFTSFVMFYDVHVPYGLTVIYRNPSVANNLGVSLKPDDKLFVQRWYKIGQVHANAALFMCALQAPVGIGQNKYQHMVNSRNNGFFNGEVLIPPAVPSGIGLAIDGFTFYTPDDETVIYTKTP